MEEGVEALAGLHDGDAVPPPSPRPDVAAPFRLNSNDAAILSSEEEGGDDDDDDISRCPPLPLAEGVDPEALILAMYEENRKLKKEVRRRDRLINKLRARVDHLEQLPEPIPYRASGADQIGDFHAINSTSLTLLSAAHHARSGSAARPALPEPLHQTDTASIRRRYMALEKGPGVKQELLFASPQSLFKSTVVLAFEEDSPSFRRKLEAMDENVEGMRNHLSRLVAIIQKYIEAGNAFTSVGRKFASELMHLEGESWFTRLGDLAPALVRFGEAFDEIQNYTDVVLASFELTFLAPMREFVKREMKEVKEMKDVITRRHEDYIACLQKYLALKKGSDDALIQTRTRDLIKVRREYELARFDLVNNLNMLETKKKFQLVERVLCALYAYLGFFHQGHTELANLEPSMRDLQHQLHLSRREFAKDSRISEAKRMQLEVHLSSALKGIQAQMALDDWGAMFSPPEALANNILAEEQQEEAAAPPPAATPEEDAHGSAVEANSSSSTTTSSASSSHQNTLSRRSASLLQSVADYVAKSNATHSFRRADTTATTTTTAGHTEHQNHETASMERDRSSSFRRRKSGGGGTALIREENPGVMSVRFQATVKQGYLWKRSSNVRKDWKRRFFSIRGGKLAYFRDHDPIGPPRGEICDLMLSTVRECQRPTDARFSFEVISPGKRPYMLQAENEEDYKDWIKALRSQTETLLVAGRLDPNVQQQSSKMDATNLNNDFLGRLLRSNHTCADCQAKNPEWASINFGIMICIECSGIHRSLGVHISKVRSLTLDKWSKPLRLLMDAMGNDKFNSVYEANVPPGRSKPSSGASRDEREAWIRDKYLRRAFLAPPPRRPPNSSDSGSQDDDEGGGDGMSAANERLYAAAKEGSLIEMIDALANGADANWANDRARGRTALHAACEEKQAGNNNLVVLELLFQNGGNMDVSDLDEVSPLDLAVKTGNNNLIAAVLAKLDRA